MFHNKKTLMYSCLLLLTCGITAIVIYLYLKHKPSEAKESFVEDKYYFIFFRANWCGHCQRFKPVWDEFVNEATMSDKYNNVDIIELDIDKEESKPLLQKHNVRGFPHVVLTKDNTTDKVFTGNRTKEELLSFLDESV